LSTPDIPTRIGRYEVDRLLGTGAMGLVYLGRDPELDRPVAIKTVRDLDLEPEAKATFLDRFRNEARAAARLHHPSIVQVYDVGEDDKLGPFLVFEYVPGSSLKQVLRSQGPLPPARLLALAGQVAEAIDTAHAAGIIHRDIKPDNLLLTSDGRTKLADFGVARVPNAALTREGQFLGTPCYAAPETLERARYGVASDLFSFAAVLYEALSGVRAFPGDDAVAVAHKVIHEAPAPPSKVSREAPAEADGPLLRGLAKHPGDRPSSARALVAELAEALAAAGRIDRRHAAEITSGATLLDAGRTRGGRSPASALAFFAVLLGALGVGVALVLSFGDGVGTGGATELARLFGAAVQVDAGTTPEPGDAEPAAALDAGAVDLADAPAAADAEADEEDAGGGDELDAGVAVGAGAAPVPLTAHEREEAAKDALARARRAMANGAWDVAEAALADARRFDPGNPDIDREAAELTARREGRTGDDGTGGPGQAPALRSPDGERGP